jgi:biotin operon repressor
MQSWTQQEVEYLVRRLAHQETHEKIALDLGRTHQAIQMMAAKLRKEGALVKRLRGGRTRLWDAQAINIAIAGKGLINDWDFDGHVPHDAIIQDTPVQ